MLLLIDISRKKIEFDFTLEEGESYFAMIHV